MRRLFFSPDITFMDQDTNWLASYLSLQTHGYSEHLNNSQIKHLLRILRNMRAGLTLEICRDLLQNSKVINTLAFLLVRCTTDCIQVKLLHHELVEIVDMLYIFILMSKCVQPYSSDFFKNTFLDVPHSEISARLISVVETARLASQPYNEQIGTLLSGLTASASDPPNREAFKIQDKKLRVYCMCLFYRYISIKNPNCSEYITQMLIAFQNLKLDTWEEIDCGLIIVRTLIKCQFKQQQFELDSIDFISRGLSRLMTIFWSKKNQPINMRDTSNRALIELFKHSEIGNVAPSQHSPVSYYREDNFWKYMTQSMSVESLARIKLILELAELLQAYIPYASRIHGNHTLIFSFIKAIACVRWSWEDIRKSASETGRDDEDIYIFVEDKIRITINRILQMEPGLPALIESDFIPVVYGLTYDMDHRNWCSKCLAISLTGCRILDNLQSMFEKIITKKDQMLQLDQFMMSVPYILTDHSALEECMFQRGGLQRLLKYLQPDHPKMERAVDALRVLARKWIKLADPQRVKCEQPKRKTKEQSDYNSIVTFKLDDGSVVKSSRQLLCEESDFFRALLDGYFKEASEEVIKIRDVSSVTLQNILALVEGVGARKTLVDIADQQDLNAERALDMISVCDRLELLPYANFLTNYTTKYLLNMENCSTIYQYSLVKIKDNCLAYVLVGQLTTTESSSLIREIFDLGCGDVLVEHIVTIFENFVKNVEAASIAAAANVSAADVAE